MQFQNVQLRRNLDAAIECTERPLDHILLSSRASKADVLPVLCVCVCAAQGKKGEKGSDTANAKLGLVSPKARREDARLIKWPSPRSVSPSRPIRQKDRISVDAGGARACRLSCPTLLRPSSIDQRTNRSISQKLFLMADAHLSVERTLKEREKHGLADILM
jgi:hypothetical protein